jgi:hypothetical protein
MDMDMDMDMPLSGTLQGAYLTGAKRLGPVLSFLQGETTFSHGIGFKYTAKVLDKVG